MVSDDVKDARRGQTMTMQREDLDALFDPRSVAVVGASDNENAAGGRVLGYLIRSYSGAIHPVNPTRDTVQGLPCAPSISALDDTPDLVIIAVPARAVLAAVKECVERGVGAIVLFTSGFAEVGAEGKALQAEITAALRGSGVRLLGPNSLGFASVGSGLYSTFSATVRRMPPLGTTAVVAQSGGLGGMVLEIVAYLGLGISYYCATGNEADLTTAEVADYLVERDDVERIVYIAEAFADPEVFRHAAQRARDLGKTFIVCKIGDSDVGARASLSHSGAVTGDADAHRAMLRRLGALTAGSLDDIVDLLRIDTATGPSISGRRLAILSVSGGAGVMLADAARANGLDVPEIDAEAQVALAATLPAFGNAANPIDATAEVTSKPEVFERALDATAALDGFDAIVVALGHMDHVADALAAAIERVAERSTTPIVVFWGGGHRRFKRRLQEAGVATFDDPRRCIDAVSAFALRAFPADAVLPADLDLAAVRRELDAIEAAVPPGASFFEDETKRALGAVGIPVVREVVVDDAAHLDSLTGLRYPLVAKLRNRELTHKSDVGGVRLGIQNAEELAGVYADLVSGPHATEGVLVQEMARVQTELACGFRRDATWGPVVMVGLGGRLLEITREVRLLAPGFSAAEAYDAVASLAGGRLLTHPRGMTEDQCRRVADILVRLGVLAEQWPRVHELDANPLAITDDGNVVVLDAVAIPGDPRER